jgi:activator of 2-hydroxyglutaryl-CoA dehydratase
MSLEKWCAIASVGLFAMFVGEIISIFHFMTDVPVNFEFGVSFEPSPKILQFISIGVAPASILAGLSFILSRRYGSKQIGLLILGGGIILLIGMAYCYTLLDKLVDTYVTDAVVITPPLFMGISIPVMIVGIILIKTNKKRPKKEYF